MKKICNIMTTCQFFFNGIVIDICIPNNENKKFEKKLNYE